MERRTFIKTCGAGLTGGLLIPGLTMGQPGGGSAPMKPRVCFFGMTLFSETGSTVTALMPSIDRHLSFAIGAPAKLLTLLGDARGQSRDALGEAHVDLGVTPWASCIATGLGSVKLQLTGGGQSTNITGGLKARLPNVRDLADQRVGKPVHRLNPREAGVWIEMIGGTLREATQGSRSPGAQPGVNWEVKLDNTTSAKDVKITDLAVFESNSDELTVSISATKSIGLGRNEILWLLNFPVLPDSARSTQSIEHAHHLFRLVGYTGRVDFTTTATLNPPPRTKPYVHPCLIFGSRAAVDPDKVQGDYGIRSLPPDSDPCLQALV